MPVSVSVWQERLGVLSCGLGISAAVIDGVATSNLLPSITSSASLHSTAGVWLIIIYQWPLLAGILILFGFSDQIGYRNIFISGLILSIASMLIVSFSNNYIFLSIARFLQGIGSSCIMGVNTSLLRFLYSKENIARGLAINSFITAASSCIGPVGAAFAVILGSWHYLYLFLAILLIVSFSLGRYSLPFAMRKEHKERILSAFPLVIISAFLTFGVGYVVHNIFLYSAIIFIILFVAVCYFSSKILSNKYKLLFSSIFTIKLVREGALVSLSAYTVQIACFIMLPFYFKLYGLTNSATLFIMAVWPCAVVIGAVIATFWSRHAFGRIIANSGCVLLGAAMIGVGGSILCRDIWLTVIMLFLGGMGFGIFQSPNNKLLLEAFPRERSGVGSGVIGISRVFGQIIGAVFSTYILSSYLNENYVSGIYFLSIGLFVVCVTIFSGNYIRLSTEIVGNDRN